MGHKALLDFTCPECRGPMHTRDEEGPPVYSCRIGHAYSMRTLLIEHGSTQERELWSAVLALDEAAAIATEAAMRMPELRDPLIEAGLEKQRQAEVIKKVIEELRPFPVE